LILLVVFLQARPVAVQQILIYFVGFSGWTSMAEAVAST